MFYDFQTDTLLPYFVLAFLYLSILVFPRLTRDFFGLLLVVGFCLALGLRDIYKMPEGADPVTYASILANASGSGSLLGDADYALFSGLHNITGSTLGLTGAFFLLHLLYLPILSLLYWVSRGVKGMFYLLAGWMLFVNSGVLLLCNFFRQGMSVLLFLALLIAFSGVVKAKWTKATGVFILPFLHLAGAPLVPGLLVCRSRRYYYVFGFYFALFCFAMSALLARVASDFAPYFEDSDQTSHQLQLLTKIAVTYLLLLLGVYLRGRLADREDRAEGLQRAAIGVLLPTIALLFNLNMPVIALRYIYYFHAVAFMFLASVIGIQKKGLALPLCALAICSSGIITWTYPTVSKLLVW
ncbi:MAG TPA: hypothetical protein VMU53_02050 [Candidatus Sulfotelmatobacter sp.]|nr:hypothetical protein [Candidatus Sulfotelmatobacter sp.]